MSQCLYITFFAAAAVVHSIASWLMPGVGAFYATLASGGAVAFLYLAAVRRRRARGACGCSLCRACRIGAVSGRPR